MVLPRRLVALCNLPAAPPILEGVNDRGGMLGMETGGVPKLTGEGEEMGTGAADDFDDFEAGGIGVALGSDMLNRVDLPVNVWLTVE